ncbi:hypothetical protein BGW80DRAFT_1284313 [Lactifluus volemus]|nr:hypothetical protein BGW80DRAFT_1284313 [Lactifluus volemus]
MTAPLSLQSAHLINSALTFGYVLPLYFTKYTRLSFSRSTENENDQSPSKGASERLRDDPAVIKARMLSVFVSTMASLCLMHRVIVAGQSQEFDRGWATTTAHLGFYVRGRDLPACLVTPVLFLGPLYARYLSRNLPFMARWTFNKQVTDIFNWIFIRNYIVGPISEEVVWRSCLIVAYRLAGASNTLMVFFTPLSFGSAHLHHIWETYNVHRRSYHQALRRAILLTLFQFTYTTLFGFHSAFLFIRTKSLLPSVSAHIFCNIMGVPQLQAELRMYPHHRRQIAFAYVAGIVLYIYGMFSWT